MYDVIVEYCIVISVCCYLWYKNKVKLFNFIITILDTKFGSVQGVQSYGGSNFGLLHSNGLSPITL